MKRFKTALKQGLAANAKYFRFEAGQTPFYKTENETIQLTEIQPFNVLFFQDLYKNFFPRDQEQIKKGKATRGLLTVVNHGDLILLALPGSAPVLEIFVPPGAEELFQDSWQRAQQAQMQISAFNQSAGNNEEKMTAPAPSDLDEKKNEKPLFADLDMSRVILNPLAAEQGSKVPPKTAMPDLEQIQAMANDRWSESPMGPETSINFEQSPARKPADKEPAKKDLGFEFQQNSASQAPIHDFTVHREEVLGGNGDLGFSDLPYQQQPTSATKTRNFASDEQNPGNQDLSRVTDLSIFEVKQTGKWMPPPPGPTKEPAQKTTLVSPQKTPSNFAKNEQTDEIFFGSDLPDDSIAAGNYPINEILRFMIKQKASDIHLTLGQPICLRVAGEMVRIENNLVTESHMRSYLEPIMPERNRREFIAGNDTDFAYEIADISRFRVNVFRDINGVGAVIRQIPNKILSIDELGLPKIVRSLCNLSKGMVLVTGPTGSGKSTTLAGMIDYINHTRHQHIITVEDPIEYVHPQGKCLINQRQVCRHTTSFSKALRAALREDPDILLIGEMRDLETIAAAIEMAETGHLVFGTLHTTTAVSTVDRIIDQFPADQQNQIRIMLAESLKGVISQTLIKTKQGGMVAGHEILVVNKAVGSLIREAKTHMIPNHMQTKKADGNLLLNESLTELVHRGLVDAKDAYIKAVDKEGLVAILQKKGIATNFAA